MAVKIYVARHGQNEDNVNGILNGRRDLPLTDLGRDQARSLADGLDEIGLQEFAAVYSSPLSRAHETAKIVCKKLNLSQQPIIMNEIIERDFGCMTGKPIEDIKRLCAPEIIETKSITYFLNPEGAETFPDLLTRGRRAIDKVQQSHSRGSILLVCHGDIGKMIFAAATGTPWRRVLHDFHFGNGELLAIDSDSRRVRLITLPQHNL